MLKQILAGIIIAILLVLSGICVERYYLAEEFEVIQESTEDTIWKDKYLKLKAKRVKQVSEISVEDHNKLVDWFHSPILFLFDTEGNNLYVTAYDDAKSAKTTFKIKVRKTKRHIIQIGYIFRTEKEHAYELAYLYDIKDIISIGAGVVVTQNNLEGFKIVAQKVF